MNFVLKYIKNNLNFAISILFILILSSILVVQSIDLNKYVIKYNQETEITEKLQSDIDSTKKQLDSLEIQVSSQAQQISDFEKQVNDQKQIIGSKDNYIKSLEEENQSLKKTLAALAAAKDGTLKAEGNYDYAIKVWNRLKAKGLNDYVCAGILGNIMAEVGGQTLDFSEWPKYSQGTYYGICQWAGSRRQRLINEFGTTLEDQISFLIVEMFEIIPKDSTFYNMQCEQDAALYFAEYYERCNPKYYAVRATNATKALQYFTK